MKLDLGKSHPGKDAILAASWSRRFPEQPEVADDSTRRSILPPRQRSIHANPTGCHWHWKCPISTA
jgi:hypothetical protein